MCWSETSATGSHLPTWYGSTNVIYMRVKCQPSHITGRTGTCSTSFTPTHFIEVGVPNQCWFCLRSCDVSRVSTIWFIFVFHWTIVLSMLRFTATYNRANSVIIKNAIILNITHNVFYLRDIESVICIILIISKKIDGLGHHLNIRK
jgi:hypothetical protein